MTVEALNALRHEVCSLHEVKRKGMKDTPVWSLAQTEQRMLITTDKGFAQHREEERCGILIIRLKKPN